MHCLYWMELCLWRIEAYGGTPQSSKDANPPVQTTQRAGISCRISFAWKTTILGSTYFHANETPSRIAPCTPEGLTPSLSSKTRKTKNRATTAFRLAARAAGNSLGPLGTFYLRIKSRLGAPKAITATAHKLARIYYKMWKRGLRTHK